MNIVNIYTNEIRDYIDLSGFEEDADGTKMQEYWQIKENMHIIIRCKIGNLRKCTKIPKTV